ncbi:hypothetical protein [Parachlamydia acanthamoebae]|uniref:hypothetical protein n=1 Tax=Parachlamydia acanthamoebae TaxID=83552 RepID=UPI00075122F7|nr:hypothetical protein [Parachlamydia acanthamoebae]
MTSFRKYLGAPGLLSIIHKQFLKIPDPREFTKNVAISITDHLMSGIAVFGLKCPSLLDYDRKRIVHPDKKNVIPLCPEAILNRRYDQKLCMR